MRRRSNGVHSHSYVVHLLSSVATHAECGRQAERVNTWPRSREEFGEATCKSCLRIRTAAASDKCIAAGGHYRDNQDRCHRCGAHIDEMGVEVSP